MDSRLHYLHGSSPAQILALLLGLVISLPTLAAPKLQTFHIEAGDATLTLNEFSRQSSLQLLFDYNVVRGRKTRAVSGEFEPSMALKQMLEDTGLVFDFVNDRTLAVTVSNHHGPGSAVAEAPSEPRRSQSAEAQSVAPGGPGTAEVRAELMAPDLDQITILGTHVRGAEPVGEHVIHLGRDDIDNDPTATVQDFLRTFPQTFGGGPTEDTHYFSAEAGTNSGLGAGINLRGLGARATLVLINGRRLAPSGTQGQFADIENIPLAAIDRIDILSDGASALYGADAVGGVVNFVMRDNFSGAETLARGGSGTQNTLEEYRVAQTLGTRWDSGNAMLSLEFYRRGALPAYARRYGTSDLTSLGGGNFDLNASNPGTLIAGGQTYAIPAGQNGTRLTSSDLVPGTQNLSNRYDGADLLPSQTRWSFYGSSRQALNDHLNLYGNAMVTRREAKLLSGGAEAPLTVTSSNPFYVNPTGGTDPVVINYNFLDDLGAMRGDVVVNDLNVTLGLDMAVGAAWIVNLYANYAQERENQSVSGLINQDALNRALLDPNPQTAFNPFGDGSHTNAATLRTIATSGRFYMDSKLETVNMTADGPIARMPGGDLKLALGADLRREIFATLVPANANSPLSETDDSRNVTSAFGEVRVPLFGKENGHRGLRQLELSVAGRYEHYNDFGHATTPKLGAAWAPVDGLAFRGSWGRSIRAPTLSDLDTSQNTVVPFPLPDKRSSQGFSYALIQLGGNSRLTVERARTWTAGFDLDARQWAPGLAFSATYFNIRFGDRIQAPIFDTNVLNDPNFAGLITRNPDAAQLTAACASGAYTPGPNLHGSTADCLQQPVNAILDARHQNLQSVRTQGIDINSSYERNWSPGTLRLRLDGTYLFDFTQQDQPGSPARQLLNTQNNPINIKLRGSVSWQQRRWGATLGINFQNHYADISSSPQRTVSSYTTFDAQWRYNLAPFATGFLQNTLLELNALNVLNQSPPFLNNRIARLGYDQENADPYGRLLSIQVRKSW